VTHKTLTHTLPSHFWPESDTADCGAINYTAEQPVILQLFGSHVNTAVNCEGESQAAAAGDIPSLIAFIYHYKRKCCFRRSTPSTNRYGLNH